MVSENVNGPRMKMTRESFWGRYGGIFTGTVLFVALVSFIALSEGNRGYQADLSVLVIPGEKATASSKDIVENVVFLSRTAKFRELFFKDSESVPGLMATADVTEMSGDAMRASFQSMISITPIGTGSMISVRALANDPDDAKDIARTSALALFRYASAYYDVDGEADFRIVDGPSVASRLPNGFLLFFGSVAIGIAVTGAIFFISSAMRNLPAMNGRRKMPLPGNPFSADIFEPKRPVSPLLSDSAPQEMPVIEPGMTEVSEKPNEPTAALNDDAFFEPEPAARTESSRRSNVTVPKSAPVTAAKQAPAPMDIPTYSEEEERFLKEFTFEEFEGDGKSHDETGDADAEEAVMPMVVEESVTSVSEESSQSEVLPSAEENHPSPTKSDYQRRLNELLRG
jgi:capsular polysaccharide biosynthesis protein